MSYPSNLHYLVKGYKSGDDVLTACAKKVHWNKSTKIKSAVGCRACNDVMKNGTLPTRVKR